MKKNILRLRYENIWIKMSYAKSQTSVYISNKITLFIRILSILRVHSNGIIWDKVRSQVMNSGQKNISILKMNLNFISAYSNNQDSSSSLFFSIFFFFFSTHIDIEKEEERNTWRAAASGIQRQAVRYENNEKRRNLWSTRRDSVTWGWARANVNLNRLSRFACN